MKKKIIAVLFGAGLLCGVLPMVTLAGGSFYIDDITSYVGIGNTTPTSRLDVSGAMYSRLVTASSSAVDWNAGNVQSLTLTSNPTLTFSNGQAGGKYDLLLKQDATGGRTVTWPASVKWPNGSAPALTTNASSTDVVSFTFDGSNYLGSYTLGYNIPKTLLNNIVGYWKLDESSGNASDSTGNGYTLTNNGSGTYIPALINNGFDTGTSNSTKYLSTTNTLGVSGGAFTINLWVKLNSGNSGNVFLSSLRSSGNAYTIYWNSGTLFFATANGNDQTFSTALSTSAFTMITFTYDGTTAKGYVNGSQVTSSSQAIGGGTTPYGFGIGSDASGDQPASALMDEAGVWNRALTSGEISTLYNAGVGLQYPF